MKIAISQNNYRIGDFDGNKTKIVNAIRKAKDSGADLVVFAEYAISGTPACDFLGRASFLNACEESLDEIAAESDGISVLVGLPMQQEGVTVSAAAFIQNGQIVNYITKKNVDFGEERAYISSGLGSEYVTVAGQKVAVALGHDVFDDEEYFAYSDTLVVMCADPFFRRRISWRYDMLKRKAFTNSRNMILVNQVGANTDVVYDGSSAIFDKRGEAVMLLDSFDEDYAELELDADNKPLAVPESNKTVNHFKAIKLCLRDFFSKNGYRKAALVLTGGVDSAVVAAMAVEALGRRNVMALLLPTGFSKFHLYEDAKSVATKLGIRYFDVDIDDAFSRMREKAQRYSTEVSVEASENLQARMAGCTLMGLLDCTGAIPLNTCNKTEIAIGDGTMYGNYIGYLSVLGDMYKHDVYALARYINRDEEVIPNRILARIPSAELKPAVFNRPKQLPSYDMLDAVLYRILEERQGKEEILNAGFDADMVDDTLEMLAASRTARYQFCPILKLSASPFNKTGNLYPITADCGFSK